MIAGLSFVQNFMMYSESGYFDATVETKPLMHLWSLGVEEQFYLFFPVSIIVLSKVASRLAYAIAVTFVGLCSFGFGLLYISDTPAGVFFSTSIPGLGVTVW